MLYLFGSFTGSAQQQEADADADTDADIEFDVDSDAEGGIAVADGGDISTDIEQS